jgi:dihydrofolate reductase
VVRSPALGGGWSSPGLESRWSAVDEAPARLVVPVRPAMSTGAAALPPLTLIAAMSSNRVIGAAGALPWHEPEDLRFFKATTAGHAVIMGRKTWDALGRPLPKRRNLVVTRQPGFAAAGAEIFPTLEAAVAAARAGDGEPMVIGGGEIYRRALPLATRVHLTEVRGEVAGDTTFPELDPRDWRLASERESGRLVFRTYERAPAP